MPSIVDTSPRVSLSNVRPPVRTSPPVILQTANRRSVHRYIPPSYSLIHPTAGRYIPAGELSHFSNEPDCDRRLICKPSGVNHSEIHLADRPTDRPTDRRSKWVSLSVVDSTDRRSGVGTSPRVILCASLPAAHGNEELRFGGFKHTRDLILVVFRSV
jgi:hypothetical protein